jgi:hypothetical protein
MVVTRSNLALPCAMRTLRTCVRNPPLLSFMGRDLTIIKHLIEGFFLQNTEYSKDEVKYVCTLLTTKVKE